MRIGRHDTDDRVLIVAEIGNNHEGDVAVAARLVEEAAEAGVDAVKFQTFRTETFVAPSQEERYARMQRFELGQDAFARLAERARAAGLLFISTPLDLPSARFLAGIVDAMKVASGDNTFYPLIEYAASTDRPVIISTGFADAERIGYARALVGRIRAGRPGGDDLALLHCVSAYPVEPADANLRAIRALADRFPGCAVGYSDHTLGTRAAPLAVAAGARVIEKHFTLDTNYSAFRDHQLSADPAMMAGLVREIRAVEALLGDGALDPRQVERDSEAPVRRSIAAARPIASGTVLGPDDIMWIRPGGGIPPGDEARVLGRRLTRCYATGELLAEADIEG